jgi:ABC-type transport system involved in cytochrome c biogenesis permease subunit
MGFVEYLAAREFASIIGQPVITYILIVALLQFIFAILVLGGKGKRYYEYLIKCLYIGTGLYILGFVVIIFFHFQIYNSVLIQYPPGLQVPFESSRFMVPLWIESEKLYFWAMVASVFVLTLKGRNELLGFLCIILSVFSSIVFFFSNPFKEPLPIVHGEITRWYAALAGEGNIYLIAGTIYGRITYYYNSTYMWTHPPMLFIAYASLIITFAACVFMLLRHARHYDEIAYRYAKPGYILLTAGMLIGYPWAMEAWKDSAWWWDPKISGSIMMWVLYSAYLHARIYIERGRLWRTTALLGVLCFVTLVFTYLLTYIVPGIHSAVQT